MVLDGLRGYLQLAIGLTEVSRERAREAARLLVAQGGTSVGAVLPDHVRVQVISLTDDLVATSRANRGLLLQLVRGEVERTVTRLGLVSAQDLTTAARRLDRVERRVTDLEAQVVGPAKRTAKKATAKKTTAKKPTKKATTTSAARSQPSPVRPPGSGPAPFPAPADAPTPATAEDPPSTSPGGGTDA